MATEKVIHSRINANPQTLATAGDVPLPILWGDDHASVVGGVILTATGLTAGADGRMLVRAGTLLVPDTTPGEYRVPADVAAVTGADHVLILKQVADLSGGKGNVGAYTRGGFIGTRMPSVADNAVAGLESAVKTNLRTRGFVFGEDYGPHGA